MAEAAVPTEPDKPKKSKKDQIKQVAELTDSGGIPKLVTGSGQEKLVIPSYFSLSTLSGSTKREQLIMSDLIFRSATNDSSEIVLDTCAAMQWIEKGQTPWTFDVNNKQGIVPSEARHRVTVEAKWHTAAQAKNAGIVIKAGDDANIFEGLGVLQVPNKFKIPTIMATKKNVKFYGCQLVNSGEDFLIESPVEDMALMEYEYKDSYRDLFLTQEHGGGGYFVERHNFPHIHAPLRPECKGYIIIGKQHTEESFSFTAFQIPFGSALYIPSNTIHGDGTLIGHYAISVARSSAPADTVLFLNKHLCDESICRENTAALDVVPRVLEH